MECLHNKLYMVHYAGIGSRQTPADILDLMTKLAIKFSKLDYILRSGRASGADQAFERGAGENKQIFLPWSTFEIEFGKANPGGTVFKFPSNEAIELAVSLHPAWQWLKHGAKLLHARNCHQVLGPDLKSPVKFVVCWTQDGAQNEKEVTRHTGGTGMAIRLASQNHIPVYNLAREESIEACQNL